MRISTVSANKRPFARDCIVWEYKCGDGLMTAKIGLRAVVWVRAKMREQGDFGRVWIPTKIKTIMWLFYCSMRYDCAWFTVVSPFCHTKWYKWRLFIVSGSPFFSLSHSLSFCFVFSHPIGLLHCRFLLLLLLLILLPLVCKCLCSVCRLFWSGLRLLLFECGEKLLECVARCSLENAMWLVLLILMCFTLFGHVLWFCFSIFRWCFFFFSFVVVVIKLAKICLTLFVSPATETEKSLLLKAEVKY